MEVRPVSAEEAPNTKRVNVPIPVPRARDAYAKTWHFVRREKYRHPEIQPWIVEELLQEGECSGTEQAYRFVFEREIWSHDGTHTWRLVVDVDPEAFLDEDEQHDLVTAYCTCCPKEDDLP